MRSGVRVARAEVCVFVGSWQVRDVDAIYVCLWAVWQLCHRARARAPAPSARCGLNTTTAPAPSWMMCSGRNTRVWCVGTAIGKARLESRSPPCGPHSTRWRATTSCPRTRRRAGSGPPAVGLQRRRGNAGSCGEAGRASLGRAWHRAAKKRAHYRDSAARLHAGAAVRAHRLPGKRGQCGLHKVSAEDGRGVYVALCCGQGFAGTEVL